MIDNYDSFTFNLVDSLQKLGNEVIVYRNDVALSFLIEKISALPEPKCVVISPGPGSPSQAGNCLALVKALYQTVPILGICLGHQIIGQAFGANIAIDSAPVHGKTSLLYHQQQDLFRNLPSPLIIGRYHSLYVNQLPAALVALGYQGEMVMALRHQTYPVFGLQFHPESILTPDGLTLLNNFMMIVKMRAIESRGDYAA
jgi:anthranilate synthase/aminodeoxychorismate synthase-like glutamine amidotransferase